MGLVPWRVRGFAQVLAAFALCAASAACSKSSPAREEQSPGEAAKQLAATPLAPPQQPLDVSGEPGRAAPQPPDTSLLNVPHPEQFALVPVESRSVADRFSGTCVVSPDVNRMVPVTSLGGGRVLQLRASLGDRVEKGQLLVSITSPDLGSALGDYHKAAADEALARKQLERSRVLFEHGSIARKDLETAEDTHQKAEIDLRTTEQRVHMLGGNPAHPMPIIELRAPVSGTIIEQNVTPSSAVKSLDNSPNLFTIADLSHVWVLCDVYENDLARARVGSIARVRLTAYPDRTIEGRIGNVSQVLDPNTRTAKVRVEVGNPGFMRPGMFGVAELVTGTRDRMVIPTTAIMRIHNTDWVFVKIGPQAFRRTAIESGREVEPGRREVLQGLVPGQQVVASGLLFAQATQP